MNSWLERWWPRQPVFQFGFAFALLIIGLLFGYQFRPTSGNADLAMLRNEVYGLRQMVTVSLLQNQSPSERLRGVSYSYNVERPDEEILSALLNTLNYDPNLNVRLAAVDALSLFYDREIIRQGIIEALSRQTSPLIQIALIDLLVEREEKRSIEVLNYLKQNHKFIQAVRIRAGKAIEQLK